MEDTLQIVKEVDEQISVDALRRIVLQPMTNKLSEKVIGYLDKSNVLKRW